MSSLLVLLEPRPVFYLFSYRLFKKRRRAAQQCKGHVLCFSFHRWMRNDGEVNVEARFWTAWVHQQGWVTVLKPQLVRVSKTGRFNLLGYIWVWSQNSCWILYLQNDEVDHDSKDLLDTFMKVCFGGLSWPCVLDNSFGCFHGLSDLFGGKWSSVVTGWWPFIKISRFTGISLMCLYGNWGQQPVILT